MFLVIFRSTPIDTIHYSTANSFSKLEHAQPADAIEQLPRQTEVHHRRMWEFVLINLLGAPLLSCSRRLETWIVEFIVCVELWYLIEIKLIPIWSSWCYRVFRFKSDHTMKLYVDSDLDRQNEYSAALIPPFPRPTFFLVLFRLVILSSLSHFISRFECLVYLLLDSGGEYIFVVMITRTVRSEGKEVEKEEQSWVNLCLSEK